jgi:hypothetical protein
MDNSWLRALRVIPATDRPTTNIRDHDDNEFPCTSYHNSHDTMLVIYLACMLSQTVSSCFLFRYVNRMVDIDLSEEQSRTFGVSTL